MCIKVIAASYIWTTVATIQHNQFYKFEYVIVLELTRYSVLFTLLFLYMPYLETLFIVSVFQFI